MNCGADWNHEDRMSSNMVDNTEIVAPLYLLVKDHKGWSEETGKPPPSRPVCEGNVGITRHLSEAVSMILEPLAHAMCGADVDSTGDFLSKVDKFNNGSIQEADKGCPDDQAEADVAQPNDSSTSFKFVCEPPDKDVKGHKRRRIEVLRNLRNRGSGIPNIQAKLQATRLLDDVEGKPAIRRLTEKPKE